MKISINFHENDSDEGKRMLVEYCADRYNKKDVNIYWPDFSPKFIFVSYEKIFQLKSHIRYVETIIKYDSSMSVIRKFNKIRNFRRG